MAGSITHTKTAGIADDATDDPDIVSPDDWNATHTFSGLAEISASAPSNNQIATWADATTIQGEASCTFDGTTFTVATTAGIDIGDGTAADIDLISVLDDDATAVLKWDDSEESFSINAPLLFSAGIKQSMWIPAFAMVAATTNGPTAEQVETSTNKINYEVLTFATNESTDIHAHFNVAFPKEWNLGTVTYQVFWTSDATDTDAVAWEMQGVAIANDGTIDSTWGTAVQVTDSAISAATANAELYVSSESGNLTIDGTPAADELCYFRITRAASDVADTITEDCALVGIKLFFTVNSAGSD